MIEEQASHPTLMPTFFGNPVSWKPPLFFWAYSIFTRLPLSLPIPMEVAYRIPSLMLSFITIPVLFRTFRNIGASKALSFFTLTIFIVSLPSINPSVSVLTDALNFFFISLSFWLYTEPKLGSWRFIAAGALSFAAFFTKLVIALMIPALALAYFHFNDKRVMKNALFALSLLSVPAAYAANMWLLHDAGLRADLYSGAFQAATPFMQFDKQIATFMGSTAIFLIGAGLWFALSIFGLIKHWRTEKFMACWYAMVLFPILTGNFMVWYYLPVMPAIAYFAALILLRWDGGDKADAFFMLFFLTALLVTVSMIIYDYHETYGMYSAEKGAGLLLAGRENVAIVGLYSPTIIATKALTELRTGGSMLDFGWIVAPRKTDALVVQEFAEDYWSDRYPVPQGNQNEFFSELYRKDTNITKFDYVAVAGNYAFSHNGTVIYNQSNITIYRMG